MALTFQKKDTGWYIIVVLAVILPLAMWIPISPLEYRFLDLATSMTSLGQITALIGMVLFAINLILTSRLKFLDKYLYGLDKVYNQHHAIGAIAFSLLLFHPLLLAVKYLQFSVRDAALFLLPSADQTKDNGIYSLALLIILMTLTFYVKMKYQRWKFFHKFTVIAFVFGFLHMFYVSSDISRNDILRAYVLGISAIGLIAAFWRSFLNQEYGNKFDFEIVKVSEVGPGVTEIEMAPKERILAYEPGQFIFVSFASLAVDREAHPFSISSSPDENTLRITIKSLGDFTSEINKLKAGDKVSVEGPYGKFSYKEAESKKQVWIAGGIGITPFLSMAKSLKNSDYKIDLYYSIRIKEEAVGLKDLVDISSRNKNFRIIPWYTGEKGYLAALDVFETSGDLGDKDIFLCGPPVFMESLRKQFIDLKVVRERIHWERFNFG